MAIDVAEIALPMNPRVARERFDAYMAGWKRTNDDEYRQVAELYKVALKGKPIIDINTVIPAAGVYDTNLPKLAICREDKRFVLYGYRDGAVCFIGQDDNRRATLGVYDDRATSLIIRVPGMPEARGWRNYAVVPMIPPELRPAPTAMKDHYILWEAEWKRVPHDPLLLKRIHGSLFYVVGQWDLTSIEQQVLAGRL